MSNLLTTVKRSTALWGFAALIAVSAIACGGDGDGADADTPSSGGTGVLDDRTFLRAEATFSMDDLVAQGYKKSREFETETLGGASEAWYGFFDQKDIEVWVFGSNDEAMSVGVPLAESVISKEAGQTDFLIPVVNRYPAFAVAGNLILLCEREIATCEALIEKLP